MRYFFSLIVFVASAIGSNAQTDFWTETFGTGCNQGQLATAYASPNGSWTVASTGTNAASANQWYVSAMENGSGEGNCGEVCGNNPTLHVGNVNVLGILPDQGAAYYEGLSGFCGILPCGATSKRAESPAIDCTGYSAISVSFLYMEGGNVQDDATLWYYDGSNWSQLDALPKTPLTCSPQGVWTARSVNLPASADNNPNIKIGFRWINNEDGNATDPSFAVDDIILTGTEESIEDCPFDFNNDGFVNTGDLVILLSDIGLSEPGQTDLNGDGVVNTGDLVVFLANFGLPCP